MEAAETPPDAADLAQTGDRDSDVLRLRFHERVLDANLFALLRADAEGIARRRARRSSDSPVGQ